MTPKEKAEELFCKMYGCEIDTDLNDIYVLNGDGYFMAKDSALIAVDEIIKSKELNYLFSQEQIYCFESTSDDRWINETFIKYWRQVKQEIEKL